MGEEGSAQEVHEQLEHFEEFNNGWGRYLALTTAIIAVISAWAALQSGTFADKALLEKNNSVLYQSKASDAWNYYQAKGVKKNIADGLAQTSNQPHFADEAKRYAKDQEGIKTTVRKSCLKSTTIWHMAIPCFRWPSPYRPLQPCLDVNYSGSFPYSQQ